MVCVHERCQQSAYTLRAWLPYLFLESNLALFLKKNPVCVVVLVCPISDSDPPGHAHFFLHLGN